jgi:hypothetical protein
LQWNPFANAAAGQAAPSESKVQSRPHAPETAEPTGPAGEHASAEPPEAASDTTIDVIPAGARFALDEPTVADPQRSMRSATPPAAPASSPPAPIVRPVLAAPLAYQPRSRRRAVTAAVCALVAAAIAFGGTWLAVHRRAHAASALQAPSAIESASSLASDESLVDIGVIGAPRLIPTAQPEVSGGTTKHAPGKHAPGRPARPRPAPHGNPSSP